MHRYLSFFYLTFFIGITILLSLPLTNANATAGCCSQHGGVSSCNHFTNHLKCVDGSDSPTCMCDNTTSNLNNTNKKTTKAPVNSTASTPKSKASTNSMTDSKEKTTKATKPATTAKTDPKLNNIAGCCSGHGGVAKCDYATGYQKCKDGTHSTTCTCSKKKSNKNN